VQDEVKMEGSVVEYKKMLILTHKTHGFWNI